LGDALRPALSCFASSRQSSLPSRRQSRFDRYRMEAQVSAADPTRWQTQQQAFSGCDYVHDDAWEYCHSVDQLGDLLDDHFWTDGHDAIVRVGRLAIMTDKFAIRVCTDEVWEFRFFDSEIAAERALASAIEARRAIDSEAGVVGDESAVPEGETPTSHVIIMLISTLIMGFCIAGSLA
jgi:hypothetical protein